MAMKTFDWIFFYLWVVLGWLCIIMGLLSGDMVMEIKGMVNVIFAYIVFKPKDGR